MTEKKYVILEVGGINCPQIETLSGDESNGQYCKINAMELCSGENCPHGKTLEEWAQKLEDNKDFQAIIDDKDVSYAEIAEVMIKALLGGESK